MSDKPPLNLVTQFDPETNSATSIAPSGTFEAGELIRLIGGNFEGSVLPITTWQTTNINGGDTSIVNGELLLGTNVTANGETRVQSVDRAEFVTATFNKAHLAFGFGDFNAVDCVSQFGMFDPVLNTFSGDGVFFRNSSGAIQIVRRSGGVDVEVVAEASFNGNPVDIANPTVKFIKDGNIHVYEILYNAGRIDFFQDRRLVHRMVSTMTVAYQTTHLTLGATIQNINANTASNTLRTRGFSCSRIGTATAEPDSITVNGPLSQLLKNSPGQMLSLIITDTGVGGAEIELHDSTDGLGTPFAIVSLTDTLVGLVFNKRLSNGLFIIASGSSFEVIINWR